MSNLSMRSYNEKRDFIRMKINAAILLSNADSEHPIEAHCKDLSGAGMLIETSQEIPAGTVCNTKIPSSNEAFPALEARIKIIRCTTIDEQQFQLGAEIIEIEA